MGRSTRTTLFHATLFHAGIVTALAVLGVAAASAASRVSVGLSQSVRLAVAGSVANVVVSNPAIADVTVVDGHSVIVIGKGYGATQIMVLDNSGHLLLDSFVTVTAPQDGQMTLFRGVAQHEFNCSPRCEADSNKPSNAAPSS